MDVGQFLEESLGYRYVLVEGNGRLNGIQQACAEKPELDSLEVEMTIIDYSQEWRRGLVLDFACDLWDSYASRMESMTEEAQLKEYSRFAASAQALRAAVPPHV